MATASKPAVLLISGGWHTPRTYHKLVKALEGAGYDIHCPRLPSMEQVRPPTAGLEEDSACLRSYAEGLVDAGRRVVAVMHSYGGQVGTQSLAGLGVDARSRSGKSGGVSDLIYVCAFALTEGGSMVGKVKEMGHEALIPLAFDFADDKTVLCRDPKLQLVGADEDAKKTEAYLADLVRWNGQCMYDSITQCAWKDIPITYVYTSADMTVPLDYQKSMVESLEGHGRAVKTFELATGHCPNQTATSDLADIITKVVG